MASKILKFVHPDRVVNQLKSEKSPDSQPEAPAENSKVSEVKNKERALNNEKFYDHINEKLEPDGVIRLITDSNSERTLLMAYITNEKYIGCSVLENNLYIAPIFWQKPRTIDFLFVRHITTEGYIKFFLRKVCTL